MIIKIPAYSTGGNAKPSLRCPSCRQVGVFEPFNNVGDVLIKPPHAEHVTWLGQRLCPSPGCQAHVFVVLGQKHEVLRSYPAQRVDFDSANIPPRIATTLSQALTCHAEECYIAAAIMIRRALEELCEDKLAQGNSLKERLSSLKGAVVLPAELFLALDELRVLGNDAAHVEAKAYDTIGKDEIEVALLLTKEILKAVYQLDDLVKRLKALKRP